MPRVLETVLTGRNLLSPMLASASKDVVAFNSTVASAQEKAAVGASASAARQEAATAKVAASNVKASTSASVTADQQVRAYTRTAESATASATAQSRAHSKAAESATLSARVQESANRSLAASNGLLGTSLTPLTAGLTAGALALAYAGYKGMEFGAAMSQVQAASQATAGDMGLLRDAAVKAGADTQYSAVEAAQGITEMAKAGVSARDILAGGLTGALNLAAAGQISVAEAAETGATALSVFRLEGNQMSHVADLLAAGAGKAQGSVGDMSAALNQSALVADQTGLSIEDTAGALAMFASNGLLGSDAGTSFKTMLQSLTPNSEQAALAMEAIGFSAYDAQGNFIGLQNVAEQLRTGLSGLSEEQRNATLKTIFGADAVRAASVLYKEGAVGVADWARKTNDAGFAQRQASELTDNLRGDLERLGGAADSFFTNLGTGTQGPLREAVQTLTALVNAGGDVLGFFNGLPGPMQAAVLAFGAWALVGDRVMGAIDGVRTRLVVLREEQQLQSALLAAQNASATGAADSYGSLAERIDATTGVTRGLGRELDTVSSKASTAKAAVGGFARAIGPELGIAAGVLVVSSIASGLSSVGDEGQQARQEIDEFNSSLKQIDGNAARLDTVDNGIKQFREKLSAAQKIISDFDNEGWFDKYVWQNPFSSDYYEGVGNARTAVDKYTNKIDELEKKQNNADKSTAALSERYGIAADDVVRLADTYGIDLTQGLDTVTAKFVSSGAASEVASGAITSVGDAAGMTQVQIEAAAKAIEEWRGQLQEIGASFVEPLSVYKGLLDEKTAKERESAEATAAATESSKDSWKDYVSESKVSLSEWADALQQQIIDQDNWRANIVTITQRGGLEVGQIFAAMGVEGATQAAQMANATDSEFQRMAGLMVQDAHNGGAGAAQALDTQMKVMAAIAASGGQATVQGIAAQLGLGVGVVAGIVAQYSSTMAAGVNPLLLSLGRPTVAGYHVAGLHGGPGGTQTKNADGNLYENHQAEIAPGGAMRIWAEPETGGESYIPHSAAKRPRALDIWRKTGKILNAPEAQYYADGGFTTAADVPRPHSVAPYSGAVGAPGDAAMGKEYDETRAWVTKTMGAMGGGGPAGAGVQRWLPLVLASLNMVGQPASLAQTVLRRMQQESGGNARAINLTDINARRGTPSKGLMQVIDPTFRAYAMPGHSSDIWDPLSNLLASERYAMARYGSLSAAYNKAGGYDSGGLATDAGYLPKQTVLPERVLSPRQTEAFERWMSIAPAAMPGYGMGGWGAAAAGGRVNVAAPNVTVKVLIDGQEFRGMARVEVDNAFQEAHDHQLYNR